MKDNLFTENLKQSSGMRIFLFLFILLVSTMVGVALSALFVFAGDTGMKFAQGFTSTMMFIVPPIVFYFVTRKVRPMRALGLRKVNTPWGLFLLIGVLLMFVSLPVTNQLTGWNEGLKIGGAFSKIEEWIKNMEEMATATTEKLLQADTIGGLFLNLLIIAMIPAIGEELTFRGVLQQSLTRGLKNPHVAILLSAALFSFFHFQFYGFIPRMFLGILLGYMFYISGSLWTSILMHFVNNGTAVVLYYLNNKGIISVDVDHFGEMPLWVTAISAVVTVALITWMWRRKRKA